jgi:hypothetical protein
MLCTSAVLAVGCRRTDVPPPESTNAIGPAPQVAEPAAKLEPVRGLVADPAVVRICDVNKGVTTTLRWDVSESGAERVVLYALSPKQEKEKPFGRGGPVGSKQTGPWVRPGMVFRLRDLTTSNELAAVTIEGATCR